MSTFLTVVCFCHFVTVFGLIPGAWLGMTSEAYDYCIAPRPTYVIVAPP
jgi:hypothetical protein